MSDDRDALVRRLFEEVFNGSRIELEPGDVDVPEHMRGVVAWLRAKFSDIETRARPNPARPGALSAAM